MTHSRYTEELYIGQHVCISPLGIGAIKEITGNIVRVQSILTGEEKEITQDQAHLLKMDLKRSAISNAINLMSELPEGFTISVQITNPSGKIVFGEEYTGGEDDRISNS